MNMWISRSEVLKCVAVCLKRRGRIHDGASCMFSDTEKALFPNEFQSFYTTVAKTNGTHNAFNFSVKQLLATDLQ